MKSAISCPLWSLVYECHNVECAFTSPVRTECGMIVICSVICLYLLFVVRGCAVSRRFINVCYCDMYSVVNMYHDHLKFGVVCINGRRYVCCYECYFVSEEYDEPTSRLVQPILAHYCEVMFFGCFEGDGNAGVGSGGCVVAVSAYIWVVHVVQVFCIVQVTC